MKLNIFKKEHKKDTCIRCGLCCHFIVGNKLTKYHCIYLFKQEHTKETTCIIYNNPNRLGIIADSIKIPLNKNMTSPMIFKCHYNKEAIFDFPGCPNNTGKKMILLV